MNMTSKGQQQQTLDHQVTPSIPLINQYQRHDNKRDHLLHEKAKVQDKSNKSRLLKEDSKKKEAQEKYSSQNYQFHQEYFMRL